MRPYMLLFVRKFGHTRRRDTVVLGYLLVRAVRCKIIVRAVQACKHNVA